MTVTFSLHSGRFIESSEESYPSFRRAERAFLVNFRTIARRCNASFARHGTVRLDSASCVH